LLIENASHSTIPGIFGVAGIYTFMAVIVVTALIRISQGLKEDHH